MSAPRYQLARERAGLSVAQASRRSGLPVATIEAADGAGPEQHATLAELYGVTPCWLAGHDPDPPAADDLRRQAAAKGVSFHDWGEIASFRSSLSVCAACKDVTP